jgi:hypothetical protein
MRSRLGTRTTISIVTTLVVAIAVVVVLATRGGSRSSVQSAAPTAAAQPAAPPPVASSAPRATPKPAVARLNPHPRTTVKGKPRSGAPPPVPFPPGSPRSLSPTNPLSNDAGAASKLLITELGPRDSAREPSIIAARCTGGACMIAFRVDAHGTGRVFGELAPLWRLLFTDPRVRSVRLLVYHSNVGARGAGRLPLFEATCARTVAPRLAANGWGYDAVSRFCRVVARTPASAAGAA